MASFEEKSYEAHSKSYSEQDVQADLSMYKNWYESNTTDLWRHLRMMHCLLPFLELDKKKSWLTIGDGRMGTAAMFIERFEGNVIASDIDTSMLEIAKKEGMIKKFAYANAEKLPYTEEEFDYSFCKESYHHFPRPHLAFYEMLRVSKKAIIFMEPADWVPAPIPRRLLQIGKNALRKIAGKKAPHKDEGAYEPSGNYVFSISIREFEKMALAMNFPYIAFKKIHDVFIPGVQSEKLSEAAPLFKKIRRKIGIMSFLRRIGIGEFNRVQIVIFKQIPSPEILKRFEELGFDIVKLPINPYIS
jgi:ubiquinone/menaquinone biosynthesis C-methylase UbiE